MPLKIAAAVLLFGGAVFALFFGSSLNLSRGDEKTSNPTRESTLVEAPAVNTAEIANQKAATTVTTESTSANQTGTENKSTVPTQNKTNEQLAKTKASKNKSAAVKPEIDDLSDEDQAELKNVGKEIDDAMAESKDKGNGFDNIPPEIRSNDPLNPVDKNKLIIYVKKRQQEAMRQVEKANRVRAAKGLPPLTPKPPRIKINAPEESEDNSNN